MQYDVDYISKFSEELAAGTILDGDGKPLGVSGGQNTQGMFQNAFKKFTSNLDPAIFNDPENANPARVKALLDPYHAGLDTTDLSDRGKARFQSFAELTENSRSKGLLTAEHIMKSSTNLKSPIVTVPVFETLHLTLQRLGCRNPNIHRERFTLP